MALTNPICSRIKIALGNKRGQYKAVGSALFSLSVLGLLSYFHAALALTHHEQKQAKVQIIKTSKLMAPIAISLEGPQAIELLRLTKTLLIIETNLTGELSIEIKGAIIENETIRRSFTLAEAKMHRLAIPLRLDPALGHLGTNKIYSLVTVTDREGRRQARSQAFAIEVVSATGELGK